MSRPKDESISLVAGRQPILTLLQAARVGSANVCCRLVDQGRVAVNGRVIRDPSSRADPVRDQVTVDDQPVAYTRVCRYVMVHKPYRVLCSFTDPEGRSTLADYVSESGIYAVGRLDYDSEGLLVLTDDGWLNHHLTHPEFEHPKTYWVQVERVPSAARLSQLARGVEIKGKMTRPAEARLLPKETAAIIPERSVPIRYRKSVPTCWLEIVLREGRKRQVRHMTAAIGHPTLRLIRSAIGPVELGDLALGEWRHLNPEELGALGRTLRSRRRRDNARLCDERSKSRSRRRSRRR